MPDSSELEELAKTEIEELDKNIVEIEESLVAELTPKDEADERGVVLEVRAGTG
jgi:peptide chain release factor 1